MATQLETLGDQLAEPLARREALEAEAGELESRGIAPNESAAAELKSVRAELDDLAQTDLLAYDDLVTQRNQLAAALLERSYLGRMGHAIEPLVKPLGWDWKIGVGVMASFPAREVIVATLGTIYSLGGEVDAGDAGLQQALKESTWPDGRPVFSLPVALSIMVFFALCAQCASTLMVIKRETNSWFWPAFTFVYMTVLAYAAAWLTNQLATRWLA